MGNCHVAGPNEVMVISGGCTGSEKRRIIIGGFGFAYWCCTDVQKMSLNVMTLTPRCVDVETKHGVALTVTAVAQVMVMAEDALSEGTGTSNRDAFLAKALEQFLGKTRQEMMDTILQTLEGHLRAILGTLDVEHIYRDRDSFAHSVRDVASPDLAKMGLEILSFTIKDVFDNVDHLESLGQKRTAEVVRDADIARAETGRDAGIAESEAEKVTASARFAADTEIANSERQYEMRRGVFEEEVNRARAEADLAYKLQAAKCQQEIRREELEVQVIERRRNIEVEQQEVLRTEKELIATVHRPAEAERFKVETLAEGRRTQDVSVAQAEAEAIKVVGAAEATSIRAIGEAEAAAMAARAAAYKDYGDAAIVSMVLDAMPQIAAEVAAPLSRIDEIVVTSGDSGSGVAGEVTKLISQLPPAVQALTGVDLRNAMKNLSSASSV